MVALFARPCAASFFFAVAVVVVVVVAVVVVVVVVVVSDGIGLADAVCSGTCNGGGG